MFNHEMAKLDVLEVHLPLLCSFDPVIISLKLYALAEVKLRSLPEGLLLA